MQKESVLAHEKAALEQDLYIQALSFYSLTKTGADGQAEHRRITQEMTVDALELALPEFDGCHDCNSLLVVAPLRGGLGLVTPETINFIKTKKMGLMVIPAAIGVKRHPETMTTDVYFQMLPEGIDYQKTAAILLDWGTATGITTAATANELVKKGIPYGKMMAISMTLPYEGEEYIKTSCPGLKQFAATRSAMNEDKYISFLAPRTIHENGRALFISVTPKDWGDWMFGMREGDPDDVIQTDIVRFSSEFGRTFEIDYSDRVDRAKKSLLSYYGGKYLGKDLG